jgi:hypothetical protein
MKNWNYVLTNIKSAINGEEARSHLSCERWCMLGPECKTAHMPLHELEGEGRWIVWLCPGQWLKEDILISQAFGPQFSAKVKDCRVRRDQWGGVKVCGEVRVRISYRINYEWGQAESTIERSWIGSHNSPLYPLIWPKLKNCFSWSILHVLYSWGEIKDHFSTQTTDRGPLVLPGPE